jgi:site-specific recombinase XerD
MNLIQLKPILHRGHECIAICFDDNTKLNSIVKKLPKAKWSQTHKSWYTSLDRESYHQIEMALKEKAVLDNSALRAYLQKRKQVAAAKDFQSFQNFGNPGSYAAKPLPTTVAWKLSKENLSALEKFVEQLKLKAYSGSTIKTYRNEFLQLLQLLKKKPVDDLTTADLKRYMVHAMEKEGISENTAHSRLNALKFYYEQVLKRDKFFFEIPRPKKQVILPKVFNQDDITAIIKAAGNIKHKTMLMLAYAAGLRVSEVVTIKVQDIDSGRMCILIKQAKGKKDRMVRLSPVLLVMLREYWKKNMPSKSGYLFPGQDKNEAYSTRSLQLVLTAAKQKAGVLKPGSIHTLRHSFATHLLDRGTDVTMIQKLLGHNDIKTTLRYLHVTNRDILQVVSPLDDLKL